MNATATSAARQSRWGWNAAICTARCARWASACAIELLFFVLALPQIFQLPAPIQRLHKPAPLAPVLFHDHMQFKKDPRAQQGFNLLARVRSDALQLAAALADQDCLLPGALAVNGRGNARQWIPGVRLRLFEALDHH